VLFTAVLGFLVAWCGIALNDRIGGWFPWIAGGALILFGLYYVVEQLRGKGHGHTHLVVGHSHELEHSHGDSHSDRHAHPQEHGHVEAMELPARKSDWAAISSLLALLTFSPCEGFIPVYVAGVRSGWSGFFLLTATLSIATVAGMIVFTALTLTGMEKLKLAWLEKYENGVLGGLLALLGVIVIAFEH
jgi:ABC-type nickel/cobalt efflux system permease component RcnA